MIGCRDNTVECGEDIYGNIELGMFYKDSSNMRSKLINTRKKKKDCRESLGWTLKWQQRLSGVGVYVAGQRIFVFNPKRASRI